MSSSRNGKEAFIDILFFTALDLRRSYLVCGVLERIISASVNQNPTSREVAASLIGTLDSSLLPSALLQLCRNLERALRNFDENLAVSLAVELAELLSPIVKGDHEIQLLILNRLSAACASASVLKTQLARQFLLNLNPRQPITAADLAEGAGIALRSISRLHDAPADGPFHDITDFAKLAGAVEVLFHALGSSGPVRMEESVLRLMTGELRAWYNRINDMTAMHLDRTLVSSLMRARANE